MDSPSTNPHEGDSADDFTEIEEDLIEHGTKRSCLDQILHPRLFDGPSPLRTEPLRKFGRACRREIKRINRLTRALVRADPGDHARLEAEVRAAASRLTQVGDTLFWTSGGHALRYAGYMNWLREKIGETVKCGLLGEKGLLITPTELVVILEQVNLTTNTEIEALPQGRTRPLSTADISKVSQATKRMAATVTSPIAARRMEAYIESKGIKQSQFAVQAGTTDRTLRSFRKTGKVRRDIFEAIANAMGTSREALLNPK